jgi:hypothetical protein
MKRLQNMLSLDLAGRPSERRPCRVRSMMRALLQVVTGWVRGGSGEVVSPREFSGG